MASTLTPQDWKRLQSVFATATELPLRERQAYLAGVYVEAPHLREPVEALLVSSDASTSIGAVIGSSAAESLHAHMPSIGDQLGAYRVESVLGRGGMSVVYRAERFDETYQQVVAIKVAAVGHIDESLRRRFLDERQILATLDHPNMARLLDGGTTPAGVPYVVMEYVDGLPIHMWCDRQELTVEQRTALMMDVARAVDYAHRHLVVHRDLKPENIYVNQQGIPKLLDFGIAKVLDTSWSGYTAAVTVDASRLMTPEYASPEQILGKSITTATDVYQLGAVLYVLLTGRALFSKTSSASIGQLERAICEQPVPKTDLDPDLDLILHKALEKEPSRRYVSAAAFANDLQRYLNGEVIDARPDSWLYRSRKFVGRNRVPTAAAALLAILILMSSVVAGVLAQRYRRERNNFEAQRNIAQTQLHQSTIEGNLLKKIFLVGDPVNTSTTKMSAVEFLDRDYESVETLLKNEPVVRVDMLDTLAKAYSDIERRDRAEKVLREDIALNTQLHGAQSPDVRDRLIKLADALAAEGKRDESVALRHQIIEMVKHEQGINSGRAINLAYQMYVHDTANLPEQSMRQERERALQSSLARDLADTGNAETRYGHLLEDYGWLAELYRIDGDLARATDAHRHVVDTVDHGNPNPTSDFAKAREYAVSPLMRLSQIATEEGDYALAEQEARESLEILHKVPSDGLYSFVYDALALSLANQGRYAEARGLFRLEEQNVVATRRPELAFLYKVSEASTEERAGNLSAAEHLLNEAMQIQQHFLGRDNMRYVCAELQSVRVLIEEHKLKAAESALEHSSSVLVSLHQPSPLMEGDLDADRAALEIAEQHWDAAGKDAMLATNLFSTRVPLAHPRLANALNLQAVMLEHQGHAVEARALRERARKLGSDFVSGIELIP